eukprot:m.111156 g.111156  ORF g.111156 m.111156 type:complete len:357 (-) comp28099_c4_seq1:131-1201(-)
MDVVFGEDFQEDTIRLVQLPPDLLAQVEAGDVICFKGGEDDAMVVCSATKTYDVKVTCTSNTVYTCVAPVGDVFDDSQSAMEINGTSGDFLEVMEGSPKLGRIHDMLQECPFKGLVEETHDLSSKRYTLKQLDEHVQASKLEISAELRRIGACEYKGVWIMLDEDYAAKVLAVVLASAITEDWKLDSLSLSSMVQTLVDHDAPEFIVETVFRLNGKVHEDNDDRYCLDVRKLSRFEGLQLLKVNNRWPLPDFMETWSEKVPDGVVPTLDDLAGDALVYNTGTVDGDQQIMFYSSSALPTDVKLRVGQLFDHQKVWSLEEIAPYLRDVATAKQSIEKILFKYARAFTQNGKKVYNKR